MSRWRSARNCIVVLIGHLITLLRILHADVPRGKEHGQATLIDAMCSPLQCCGRIRTSWIHTVDMDATGVVVSIVAVVVVTGHVTKLVVSICKVIYL